MALQDKESNTMLANTKKSEPIQLDVKLHRSNMQTFLRAAEAKLGTQYPRECIKFLRTNDPWKARAYFEFLKIKIQNKNTFLCCVVPVSRYMCNIAIYMDHTFT